MVIRACIAAATIGLYVAGCAFLPSGKDKLEVRPVKYVPCGEDMGPNTSCGSSTVPPEQAEGFVVTVGWKRFNDITNQSGFISHADAGATRRFAEFAAQEIVARGYCEQAKAREPVEVLGWEGSGDRGIYVVCSERIRKPHP